MKSIKVFISSVMDELKDERMIAKEAITELFNKHKMPFRTIMFEDIGARSENARKAYTEEIKKSDIYLGIIGKEYGNIIYDNISATKEEYTIAYNNRKDIFIYILEIDERKYVREKFTEEFIKEVRNHHVAPTFSDKNDLKAKIKDDLIRWYDKKIKYENLEVFKPISKITPEDFMLKKTNNLYISRETDKTIKNFLKERNNVLIIG